MKSITSTLISLSVIFLFCVFPFIFLTYQLLYNQGELDFSAFLQVIEHPLTTKSLKNSLFICSSTVLLSCLIAIPIAWFLTRSSINHKSFWKTLFSLPYAIPPFIGAIAWIQLANPSNGLLKHLFPAINIYSSFGLIFVMSSFYYTYILLNIINTLEKIDPSLEESARISGATPFKVFFKITLPLILPSLLTGILLTFLSALANFGIAALIGNPASISMLTTQIYTLQKTASVQGLKMSGALSVFLLIVSLSVFILDIYISKKFRYSLVTGKSARVNQVDLGYWKYVANAFLIISAIILFLLPIISILISSLSPIQGQFSFSSLTLNNFGTILFRTEETYRALSNSFILAISASLICLCFGYIFAKTQTNKLKDLFISIPYAVPGTVLSLSLTLIVLAYKLPLYNTLGIILLAYVVKFLNFSYRSLQDGINQIDKSLIEAGKVFGANSMQRLLKIWLPLLKPFIIASIFLVFMPAFSELTMSVLLTGPGNETIGTLIFQLQEYGDASGSGASVLSLCTLLLILGLNSLLKFITKGKFGL